MCSELQHEVIRLRERVNERLGELVPPEDAPPEQLHKAIRYSLVAPGKRIRPLMTLLTATRLGGDVEVGLDPACAVEMIHTASLIVDDMPFMDDAEMRRGRPANHRVFGQDVAALAAFDLVSRAFGTLAGARGLDDTQRTELVRLLSEALAGEGV
ncbi:MAG: polyprenyl synthetase family protein, partial [Acidobacteriota bacterium]